MIRHAVLIVGLSAIIIITIIYPFLPGDYDPLALGLSTMAQVFGVLGLPLVVIGALWLGFAAWNAARRRQHQPTKATGFTFALITLLLSTLLILAIVLVAYATIGIAFAMLTLALWLYTLSRLIPTLQALKHSDSWRFNPAPIYFVVLPMVALLTQWLLVAPLTESSRNHAIAMSATMIRHLEAYHTHNGRYPTSLLAVWQDYAPSVVGIERYHYAPQGEAYNLMFEQPRFLFDDIGTREFMVFNSRDEHAMISHDSWILLLPPEELESTQGWFAVHDAAHPHWKYFWFD